MKTAMTVLSIAMFLVASSLSAAQSSDAPDERTVRSGIAESDGELTPEVRVHIERGNALGNTLRFAAAAREYARAAEIARRQGHLASGTTWMVATALFNDGNLIGAAAALDQLATEASQVGDLAVQALALFNSAWLNGKAGRTTETAARVAQLERLLRSQYMPVAIREDLSARLSTPGKIAVRR